MNITYHIDDIDQVARQILSQTSNKVFLLDAPMGSGKTTLINAMCKQLGIKEVTSSPTFSIVNEYKTDKLTVYHFDLYRIKDKTELFDIGIEEYLDSNAYLFIEWPDLLTPYLEQFTTVKIEIIDSDLRKISLN
ncbi:tRNA (adenosine(37)-N6)-threonylcarbamoyltransferase complex ATPase subunit type 1 TsaE [Nonlabens mediterrranea]|uniref:tRNA threonylcarbamoyladenosine biosynthesis protein TsaE n=1 Tax=Nonlabens mediterrranea TaxID=1419947 RepID=A0ABS0A1G7_9FLAO|nr:tRNA (adenosine(37)-N6)-threonylcarbamoyltransferase complex ATPase subunit type 1 TsaE [Nonlabens mediterrranea]